MNNPRIIKKIVTYRASSLGDSLMGKYFLENVHAAYPQAECFMLVGSRAGMIRELFKAYPWLTIIEANRKNRTSIREAWRILRGSDLSLTQYAENPFSLGTKLFARLATKRGGFFGFYDRWWGNRLLYDRIIPFPGEAKSEGPIVEEQKALRAAGIPVSIPRFSLLFETDNRVFPKFFVGPRRYVLAHLFSGSEGRNMSQEKRTEIVERVSERLPSGVMLILTGTKEDLPRAEESARGRKNVLVLAGKTSITEFINLIANASIVLALNTGAAHIAVHTGTPLVVMTHAGGKNWFSPAMYGGAPTVLSAEQEDDAAPRTSAHPLSLEKIETDRIVQAVLEGARSML